MLAEPVGLAYQVVGVRRARTAGLKQLSELQHLKVLQPVIPGEVAPKSPNPPEEEERARLNRLGLIRRPAPVAWQAPEVKSGRRSAAQAERKRLDQLWYVVATKMATQGYKGWQTWHCRGTWRDLKRCIQAVDGLLLGD